MSEHGVGRILLLRLAGCLDGKGTSPEDIATRVKRAGVKFLIIDATDSAYVDTPGVRWLLRLRTLMEEMGKALRIVARPASRVAKNLQILHVGIDCYDSVAGAWKTPWRIIQRSMPQAAA